MDLVERLSGACVAVLPDATVILHGSLALGDFRPGSSDVDLLVISDKPTDGLVAAVEREWKEDPTNLDLRVVTYAVAATPTRAPHMALYVSLTAEHGLYVECERDEPDLVIEFSVCRQLGHTGVIGEASRRLGRRRRRRGGRALEADRLRPAAPGVDGAHRVPHLAIPRGTYPLLQALRRSLDACTRC